MRLSHRSHHRAFARGLLIIVVTLLALVAPNLGSSTLPLASAAQASGPTTLSGSIPPLVQEGKATYVGPYNPNQMLRLVIGLQPPQLAQEEQYLKDIQNKHSPLFHHFLTADQWNARFGPSTQAEQAVVSWAQSQSLTVTHRYANRLIVDVAATVSTIEKAFNVTINTYKNGTHTFFSNDRAPTIPTSLSGIVEAVLGMDSLQVAQPTTKSKGPTGFTGPVYVNAPTVAQGTSIHGNGDARKLPASLKKGTRAHPHITNGSYDPTDLYSSEAYNVNGLYSQGHCCNPTGISGGTGPLTSIGIATAGDFQNSDIAGFQSQYPYLAYDIGRVYIDGTPSCCNDETTLDTEWSTAMSNSFGCYCNTATVIVYAGVNAAFSTFTDIYNQMLSDGSARSFTTSWGCTEYTCTSDGTMNTDHSIFDAMVGQGWSLTAASGDQGAYDDCTSNTPRLNYPSSDPDMVAAGGSTLYLNGDGTFNSEVAWTGPSGSCGGNAGGGGGGFSAKWGTPSYQSALGFSSRATPDVALNAAHGQNYYFSGGLFGVGGTSIVAPELSGLFAQENSYLLFEGNICGLGSGTSPCAPMGNPDYAIYNAALGNGAGLPPHNPFYDITSGCNGNGAGTGYCAGTGFDEATGWGSFNWLQMAWAINWDTLADSGRPTVTFSGPTTGQWYNTDQTVSWNVADTGGGYPPGGVAGFSQAWDVDPGDPTSGTQGCCSDFYGPQFPNATSGSLDLASAGQGCHTANVEAWDNMGLQSGDQTYGTVCYDTIAPHTTASLSGTPNGGGLFFPPVTVTLTATDSLSGVASTVYQVDGGSVHTYSGPFTVSSVGTHTVTFHSTDRAGNVESTQSTSFTIVQWTSQSSGTTNSLRAIACSGTSPNTCEVVGVNGTIRATTNGGSSWHAQTSGTSNTLNAVTCPSTSVCFAVGASGTIRATTNGGTSWHTQTSGTTSNLTAIGCGNTSTCIAVGANGTIRATTNGGTSWHAQTSGTTKTLNAVACPSVSDCFAVGINGTIRATTNGGTSWHAQTSGTTNNLNGVRCANTSTCFAVGVNGTIRATTNGGSSWHAQTSGTTKTLNAVNCASTSICIAVGASGTILATSNGGTTWSKQPDSTTNTLYGVRCLSISTSYAVGDVGTILRKG